MTEQPPACISDIREVKKDIGKLTSYTHDLSKTVAELVVHIEHLVKTLNSDTGLKVGLKDEIILRVHGDDDNANKIGRLSKLVYIGVGIFLVCQIVLVAYLSR